MQITENAAMGDPAVADAMSRYLEIKGTIDEYMRGDPEPAVLAQYGAQLDEAKRQMDAIPAVSAMMSSRERFSEMMNQVNHVMQFIITGETQDGSGCSGNCGACAGCH